MNYTCVCVGGFLLLELLWWIVAGKKYSRRMQKVREEEKHGVIIMISLQRNHMDTCMKLS